jgi:putative ABC transport system permease protein
VWLSEDYVDRAERGGSSLNAANLDDIRQGLTTIEDVAPYAYYSVNLSGGDGPERARGLAVGHRFFDALDVQPALGRDFAYEDDVRGAGGVTILTEELWSDRFGADPDIIGREVYLQGEPHTVIGVLPAGFEFRTSPRLFIPLGFEGVEHGRRGRQINAIGRLTPGATIESARAELVALYAPLAELYPEENENWTGWADTLGRLHIGTAPREALQMLAWSVGLVFLVACINLANLLLVRAEARQRETAVRVALGGSLVLHFIGEAMVLSLLGGAAGVGLAYSGVRVVTTAFGGMLPRGDEIGIDATVVLFALGLSALAGLLAGLFPLVRTDVSHLQADLKEGARGVSRSGSRLRRGLVVGELALAVVLIKSFQRVAGIDIGLERPEDVLVAQLSLPSIRYPDREARARFYERFLAEVEAIPGVVASGLSSRLPLYGGTNFTEVPVVGDPERFATFVEWREVTPGFFDAVGVRLEEGRMLDRDDATADTLRTILINRELATQLFGSGRAVGQWIDVFGDGVGLEIVGVVSDIRDLGHERPKPPGVYAPVGLATANSGAFVLTLASGDPPDLVGPMRERLSALDPELPLFGTQTLDEVVDRRLGTRRFAVVLLIVFAGLALLLGTVGVYGVISYAVTQRTREIGVRLALGARRTEVVRLVLRSGAWMTVLGVTIGLAGSYGAAQLVRNQLFEVGAADPVTYVAVALILGSVAMMASWLPARRASSTDPLEALRHE